MKNAIEYFYKLRPINIHQNKDEYFFEINKEYYSLKQCNRSIEEINDLYNLEHELYRNNVYIHQIIMNINRELITSINNKNYILMRMFIIDNRKITLNDIKNLSNIMIVGNYHSINRNDWRILWEKKIDYIEYQIEENKFKYKELGLNVDYFIGLVENAIQLLYGINNKNSYLSHQRINSNMRVRELYDPLNIVVDSKVRDISEYFKDKIFKSETIEAEIYKYLNKNNLNAVDLKLLFIRFLFVTKYFDLFDFVIMDGYEKVSNEFDLIINKIDVYEKIIKNIYNVMYSKQILPEIEWLKKQAF